MVDLGTLGGNTSYGYAINDAGQVAGASYMTGDIVQHAFLYTGIPGSGGNMADLGTLGGSNSYARAINGINQIVGYSQISGDAAQHAFVYTGVPGSGGQMADLGTLGGTSSWGNAINSARVIVGASRTAGDANQRAFLYTGTPGSGGQMIDLDAWLDANNPTEGAKWTLWSASGISDTGWVTGTGDYNDGPGGLTDGQRAFVLDVSSLVPEPVAISLLGFGLVSVLCRRHRPSNAR